MRREFALVLCLAVMACSEQSATNQTFDANFVMMNAAEEMMNAAEDEQLTPREQLDAALERQNQAAIACCRQTRGTVKARYRGFAGDQMVTANRVRAWNGPLDETNIPALVAEIDRTQELLRTARDDRARLAALEAADAALTRVDDWLDGPG